MHHQSLLRVNFPRCKESTQLLSYDSSKTTWPVSQLESFFLPDFPLLSDENETDFRLLGEINKGSFGKVYQVEDKKDGKIYALKVFSKANVCRFFCYEHVFFNFSCSFR